jgi:transaldolase
MTTPSLSDLKIEIYADGANIDAIKDLARQPYVAGFTTNPTLMKQAGISDYKKFALSVLEFITDRPVSFEVFADDLPTMRAQALEINTWAKNVFVKIPITNTKGEKCASMIRELSSQGVKLNITAMMTLEQVKDVAEALNATTEAVVSVFAGRIADTGRDPIPFMCEAKNILATRPKAKLLWASPRELLNIFQANESGCDIITVPPDILKKLSLIGKDLEGYSLETVAMFYRDAMAAGFNIRTE